MNNILFWIGVFFIPFDNLAIAPSSGWAAISPYIFLLYVLSRFGLAIESVVELLSSSSAAFKIWLVSAAILSVVAWVSYGAIYSLLIIGLIKLILGFSFLLALLIVSSTEELWFSKLIKILSVAYSVSIGAGLMQFFRGVFGINFDFVFEAIFARYYSEKIQFTFTEPSFASIHIVGVIIPVVYIALKNRIAFSKLFLIGLAIALISIASGSSLRVVVDGSIIFIIYNFIERRFNIKYALYVFVAGFIIYIFAPSVFVDRVCGLVGCGDAAEEYVDPSKEIRKFRSEAALSGVSDDFVKTLFGVGAFNAAVAIDSGFASASQGLSDDYTEIIELNIHPDGLTYSIYSKWIAEHGYVGLVFILFFLYEKRNIFIFLCVIVSFAQFDSYAFYSMWLYIYLNAKNIYLNDTYS